MTLRKRIMALHGARRGKGQSMETHQISSVLGLNRQTVLKRRSICAHDAEDLRLAGHGDPR